MKYSSKFEKGWNFYMKHADKFTFCGQLPKDFEYDPDGPSAKEVFYNWEAGHGLMPTSEPELLAKIHNCKSSINFQIKEWVEGFEDMMNPVDCYMESFDNPPKWIRKAFVNALKRKWGPNAEKRFKWEDPIDLKDPDIQELVTKLRMSAPTPNPE